MPDAEEVSVRVVRVFRGWSLIFGKTDGRRAAFLQGLVDPAVVESAELGDSGLWLPGGINGTIPMGIDLA